LEAHIRALEANTTALGPDLKAEAAEANRRLEAIEKELIGQRHQPRGR
jgi:hypothetical protein